MPIILQEHETLESRHSVSTKFGRGTLYVTDRALIIEIRKRGIVFHRYHNQIAGIAVLGMRKIRVTWPEYNRLFDFEFKAWGASNIVRDITQKHHYNSNYTRENVSHVMYTDEQRMKIRRQRQKMAEKRLGEAEKRLKKTSESEAAIDVEMWRQYIHQDIKRSIINRSVRVPDYVEDHVVWNDCWIDQMGNGGLEGDGNYIYTFNHYWLSGKFAKSPVRGAKIHDETGAYGISIRHVKWYRGYPYVRGNAFETPIYEMGFFIPTMLDVMIDDSLISRRHNLWRRLERGEMPSQDNPAVLGYLEDPNVPAKESQTVGYCSIMDLEFFCRRGIIHEDEARELGLSVPIVDESEIKRLLEADKRDAASIVRWWTPP